MQSITAMCREEDTWSAFGDSVCMARLHSSIEIDWLGLWRMQVNCFIAGEQRESERELGKATSRGLQATSPDQLLLSCSTVFSLYEAS